MELSDVVSACDDVVAREVAGEAVLLNLASGTYFGLNDTGSMIWQMIEENSASIAEICDAVEEEYDVEREDAERDVLALVEQLVEHGLLMVEDAVEDEDQEV